MMKWSCCAALAIVLFLAGEEASTIESNTIVVDKLLVLAIDVSGSVDDEEFALVKRGYQAAFEDERIIQAIQSGPTGRIAVTVLLWAGLHDGEGWYPRAEIASVMILWRVISDTASSRQLGNDIALLERFDSSGSFTCVGGVLKLATAVLASSPYASHHQIIDVSGNGPDDGLPDCLSDLRVERDIVLEKGIVINGLPILDPKEQKDVVIFYREQVVGGAGSFFVVAQSFEQFKEAILAKLLRELSQRVASK